MKFFRVSYFKSGTQRRNVKEVVYFVLISMCFPRLGENYLRKVFFCLGMEIIIADCT